LSALGIVVAATAFGLCFCALVKNTRQASTLTGGLLTVTGMVGMLGVFFAGNSSTLSQTVPLLVPQGWAVRGLMASLHGAAAGEVALNLVILLAWSAAFFTLGILRFHKKFDYRTL
jgi:ABC-type multidrug transport system permease subunit